MMVEPSMNVSYLGSRGIESPGMAGDYVARINDDREGIAEMLPYTTGSKLPGKRIPRGWA